jgi:hydrogenase/urease accessory protein HupE
MRSALLLLTAVPLLAHDARPLSIVITEQSPHVYSVNVVVPPSVEADNQPKVEWPAGCEVRGQTTPSSFSSDARRMLISCASGLEKQTIRVKYALFNPSLATFWRMQPVVGEVRNAVTPPQTLEWTVPANPSRLEVARDYWLLGIEHIWKGVDHLLFVLGLLILAGTTKRIILAITGFSAAHSITLSLSALGFVHMPVPPTEAAIALSIMFLASEIARGRPDSLTTRYPLLVSASFGLLHGLGFAAALGEIGLPPKEIPTSLLFFSIGVEMGQMLFILPVIGLLRLAANWSWRPAIAKWAPYGIGIVASFWFVERVTKFWP